MISILKFILASFKDFLPLILLTTPVILYYNPNQTTECLVGIGIMITLFRLMLHAHFNSSQAKRSSFLRLSPITSPLTWLGLFTFLSTLYISLGYAYEQKDRLLLVLIIIPLIIGLLALLLCVESFRIRRSLEDADALKALEAEVDQDLLTGFRFPSIQKIPFFQLKINWISPPIHHYELILDQGDLAEVVRFSRRGSLTQVKREFILEDLLGLTSFSWIWTQKSQFSILPKSVRLDPQSVRQIQEGEDEFDQSGTPEGDYLELRRYQPGDPLKLVMWRVYARSRQLMVRAPERALSLKDDLVAYFISDPTDESSASTTRAYLEQNLLGNDFTFFADGAIGSAKDRVSAQIHLLQSIHGYPGQALSEILALDPKKLRGCLVFASACLDPEVLHSILSQFPSPPHVLLSYPYEESSLQTPSKLQEYFFKPQVDPSSTGLHPHVIAQNYGTLQQLGFSPTLIVQPEGRVVSDLEIEKLTHP